MYNLPEMLGSSSLFYFMTERARHNVLRYLVSIGRMSEEKLVATEILMEYIGEVMHIDDP